MSVQPHWIIPAKGSSINPKLCLKPHAATGLQLYFVLSLPCFGQLDRGTITGTVTDSSGAAIPGAKITIRNKGTNATYESKTTGTGDYSAVNLPAGIYDVTVCGVRVEDTGPVRIFSSPCRKRSAWMPSLPVGRIQGDRNGICGRACPSDRQSGGWSGAAEPHGE